MTKTANLSPLEAKLLAGAKAELMHWKAADPQGVHNQPSWRERARYREAVADANYDSVALNVTAWIGPGYQNDRGRKQVSRALASLEQKGLVERLRVRSSRTSHLRLTAPGQATP